MLFKALKRRLSNIKPVVKPQGHCPKKRKYVHVDGNKDLEHSGKKMASSEKTDEGDDEEMINKTSK